MLTVIAHNNHDRYMVMMVSGEFLPAEGEKHSTSLPEMAAMVHEAESGGDQEGLGAK